MSPRYISAFLIGFIFGVAAASLYAITGWWLLIALCGGMFLAMALALVSRTACVAVVCVVLGMGVGVWRVNSTFGSNEYSPFLNQPFETEGVIAADPTASGSSQQLTILPDHFHQYLRASMYTALPDVAVGDRVWIRGQPQLPENFSDFDYVGYLQRWNVYAVLKKPRVIVLERSGWSWRTPLVQLRDYVIQKTKAFSASEGSLIAGMLIGQRQQPLPDDVANAFKITGLTHIVAVSGFNMTIIATACGALVWYIGRRATNILTIIVMIGFVVITGASAAVVRAAIMAGVMVTAQLLGRQYASLYSLLLVAGIMIALNPRVVIWDVGFQLSIAATYGVLISFRTKATAATSSTGDKPSGFLDDLLRPTFGAIVMTAPIIAYHFETFSLIAPLANLLVLPLVPWIMLFGALTLVPIFGSAFIFPAQLLAAAVLKITEKLAAVPHASIALHLPIWALAAYYIIVFLYIAKTSSN